MVARGGAGAGGETRPPLFTPAAERGNVDPMNALPPPIEPPTMTLAAAIGRIIGHTAAVAHRLPDALEATRGVAKLGLPRAVRLRAVAFFDRAIEVVTTVSLVAEATRKEETP